LAPRMRLGVLAGLTAFLLAGCETDGTGSAGGGTAISIQEPFQDCDECPLMVAVPAGSFIMGSPLSEGGRSSDEGPQHQVQIGEAFALSQYEVTFDEWDACVKGGGCNGYGSGDAGWGRGRRPVIYVSWKHAQAYVAWLSKVTGYTYRLPSEAEWSTPPAQERRRARRGPIFTGTSAKPRRSAPTQPIPGASTTCTATSGSGSRTAGTPATMALQPMAVPGRAAIAAAGSCAGILEQLATERPPLG
jgi:hypothetical protein